MANVECTVHCMWLVLLVWWLMIRIRITHKILINFVYSSIFVFFIIYKRRFSNGVLLWISHLTQIICSCACVCVCMNLRSRSDNCWNFSQKVRWQTEFYRCAYGLFHSYNYGDKNDYNDNFYRYYCPLNCCCLNGATLSWFSTRKKNKMKRKDKIRKIEYNIWRIVKWGWYDDD